MTPGKPALPGQPAYLSNPIIISHYDYMEARLALFGETSLVASGLACFAGMKFPI